MLKKIKMRAIGKHWLGIKKIGRTSWDEQVIFNASKDGFSKPTLESKGRTYCMRSFRINYRCSATQVQVLEMCLTPNNTAAAGFHFCNTWGRTALPRK